MKKILALIFCFTPLLVCGQLIPIVTFDSGDTTYHHFVAIDTLNCHRKIWQIGSPHKTVFTSALSVPNVIVTDTANAYAANDTSVFILKIPKKIPTSPGSVYFVPLFSFQFSYQLNIDSNAITRIELSDNAGLYWHDLKYPLLSHYTLYGWPSNLLSTSSWTPVFMGWDSTGNDSILLRFTFISGSNPSAKDGWMIDDFRFSYGYESVPLLQNDNLVSIYPNPTKGNIYLHSPKPPSMHSSICVYNMQGQEVFTTDKVSQNCYLNLPLPDGVYTLKYTQDDEYCVKRIVIEK